MALRVGPMVRPAYRRRFSKRRLTPPQVLAMRCLMRDEDWTFREAEVRLAEHHALRRALGLDRVPDDPTLDRVLRRLNETVLEPLVRAIIHRLLPQPRPRTTVAVDATGLAPGTIRPCFVTRAKARAPGFPWRHWRKWTMVVDLDRRLLLAQTARRGPTHDGATWRPLVSAAHERVSSGLVLAEAEVDGERHPQHSRQVLQAQSVIPAKRGGAAWTMHGVRAPRRQELPAALDRQRALMASLISAVKRQRSARAPGRSLVTQCLQAVLLGGADTVDRLEFRLPIARLRMSTEPYYLEKRTPAVMGTSSGLTG